MRIKKVSQHWQGDTATLEIEYDSRDIKAVSKKLEDVEPGEYDLELEKTRKKRSLDANGYMWQLIDKIADKTRKKRGDIYRNAIRENGVFDDLAVINKAVERFADKWSRKGIGWFTDLEPSKISGCTKVRAYYGSSTYDTKEMSRLIDAVVQDAEAVGIETMTPLELEHLKSQWG